MSDTSIYTVRQHVQNLGNLGHAPLTGLFLIGSISDVVDEMVKNRKNPLFQRIYSKITLLPFGSLEIVRLYSFLGITKPSLMLSLHSLFGGKPFPYRQVYSAGLLRGNDTDILKVVKEFFASELQQESADVQFGPRLAKALQIVSENKQKEVQLKKIKETLKAGETEAFHILHNDLFIRYGVIEPVYSFRELNKSRIDRYEISDPLIALTEHRRNSSTQTRRHDATGELFISESEFHQHEGLHFQRWIVEIAQDRYLLTGCPSFPYLENSSPCVFAPRLLWDLEKEEEEEVDIDVVASQPATRTLIIGSCTRDREKISVNKLREQYDKLFSNESSMNALQKLLKLDGSAVPVRVQFYHFTPDCTSEQVTDKKGNTHYVVSLTEMLAPFRSDHGMLVKNKGNNIIGDERELESKYR